MKGLLGLLIIGVVCSLSTGSYSYSKANKCRSECKIDDHCRYVGYVCKATVCQGKTIKKCVKASVMHKPDVMVPLTTGVLHGNDPRDGIIPGEIINVKTGGGHLGDTGIPPLNFGNGFPNVGMLPVVKPGSPDLLPIDPSTGLNVADKIFLCVDNCAESSRCFGNKDCLLGCKQLCENGQSLIDIPTGINTGLKGNIQHTGPILPHTGPILPHTGPILPHTGPILPHTGEILPVGPMENHLSGSKILRGDLNIGMVIGETNQQFGVDAGSIPIGAIDSTLSNKQIDILAKNKMTGKHGVLPNVDFGSPLTVDLNGQLTKPGMIDNSFSTGKLHPKVDMLGKKDILNGQHMDIKSNIPINGRVGPMSGFSPIDARFPVGNGPLNRGGPFIPVDPRMMNGMIDSSLSTGQFVDQPFVDAAIDGYPKADILGKKDVLNGQHINIKSDLPMNRAIGPMSGFSPVDGGFPVKNGPLNQGSPFIPVDPLMGSGPFPGNHFAQHGQIGGGFNPLFPVNTAEGNFPHGPISLGGNGDFGPLQPLDNIGPIGHLDSNMPVIDKGVGGHIDKPVLVDSNGQVKVINSHVGQKHGKMGGLVLPETGKVLPLVPTKPLISKHDLLPTKELTDQCLGMRGCPGGLMCVRRGDRNVCIKKPLGNNYQPS